MFHRISNAAAILAVFASLSPCRQSEDNNRPPAAEKRNLFLTHGDNGRMQFNYYEIVGNSAAAAISNAYDADNPTAARRAK